MKIAIAGAGKLGMKVTEALLGGDHSVTVIDKDEEILAKLSSQMDVMTVHANAKQKSVLEDLNISSYDYLLATTDKDEKNIIIASIAKKLGCSMVIARVRGPEHMNQFDFIKETFHVDSIVNPDLAITMEIYKYLVEKYTLSNGIFTSGKIAIIEMAAFKMPSIVGVPMTEIGHHLKHMLVIGISRNGKVIIPHGKTVVQEEDFLYVVGEKNPIMELDAKVHLKGKYNDLQRVMIIGGGKTGLYLAQKLSEFGIAVKIIEVSKERCHYLATHLDDVMVLHGDGTDTAFLESENLDEMDAFVTTTGYDEENLLLALMAKQKGIEDVIAKISRESYSGLIEKMGVDMVLNPLNITASNILRFIQGSKRILSSQLIQGQAEIMEIVAGHHMAILDTPLQELNLPDGTIIAAIHRGTNVIIPKGDTKIIEGDRVLIMCLLSELSTLEKLMRSTGRLGIFG
jgi:trk system potassium uptake protein TrkA